MFKAGSIYESYEETQSSSWKKLNGKFFLVVLKEFKNKIVIMILHIYCKAHRLRILRWKKLTD
jgi:hypothetical protein